MIQTPKLEELQLSTNTRYLLAQHLYWIINGYDIIKINEVIKTISYEDPFCATTLYQMERKIGTSINTDFELEELEKLTYFYPCLIKFDGNLDFLKYCKSLKEVDFGCLNLEDINSLAYLKNLTNINLSSNNINSIDSLTTLENLEEINLGGCNPVSLIPLKQHKKIRKIVFDDIENEVFLMQKNTNDEISNIIKSANKQGVNSKILIKSFIINSILNPTTNYNSSL